MKEWRKGQVTPSELFFLSFGLALGFVFGLIVGLG